MALDVPREGEEFGEHLSDRYVYLTNAVARLAREHDPEAGAVMYAYNAAEQPPRRERVEPNVVVGIVPTTVDLEELEQLQVLTELRQQELVVEVEVEIVVNLEVVLAVLEVEEQEELLTVDLVQQ